MARTDYLKEFVKCLESIEYGRSNYEIFQDFLTLASASFYNLLIKDEKVEQEYLETIKKYKNPNKICELLAITTLALEEKMQDFLGEVFMFGGLGNKNTGQFFTPYHIAEMMSKIIISEDLIKQQIEEKGFFELDEPACGSGVMIIAMADTLLTLGYNPQKVFRFSGTDVDIKCCQMAYIQTSILGLKGVIRHGDTLKYEFWKDFVTPFMYIPI